MNYARVVYDFQTTEDGEIALHHNDIVLWLYDVDENWACGKFYGQIGTFPKAFVEHIQVPAVEHGQKIFAAVKTFGGEMSGDLSFQRGDIVIGLKQIDANWFHGQNGDQFGMFPITHVRELDIAPPADSLPPSTTPSSQSTSGQHSDSSRQGYDTKNSENPATGDQKYIAKAVASMDVSAQIDEELGFYKGDVVNIIKALDSDFAIGECNGKTGMFPLAFVEIYEGHINTVSSAQEKRRSKFRWWEEESSANENVVDQNRINEQKQDSSFNMHNSSSNDTPQSFSLAPNSDSFYEPPNENAGIIHVTHGTESHDSYGYTVSNTKSHESKVKTHRRTGSYTQENTRSHDSYIVPYARTLFPFIAENPNELTFTDNEIVTLIQHIDEQWIEGEMDGKCGIFPTGYVEIIVDCPWMKNTHQLDENADNSQFSPQTTTQIYGESEDRNELQSSGADISVSMDTSVSANESVNLQTPESRTAMHPGSPAQNNPNLGHASTQNKQESVESTNTQPSSSCFGLVLYDYKPDVITEASFSEGDTVAILQQVDDDWYAVESESGQRGFCPVTYIDVLCLCPVPKFVVAQATENSFVSNSESKTEPEPIKSEHAVTNSIQNQTIVDQTNKTAAGHVLTKIANEKSVPSKPLKTKPKPAIKPKPSVKPKPVLKATDKKPEIAQKTTTDIAQNLDSIRTEPSDIPLPETKSCDSKSGERVQPEIKSSGEQVSSNENSPREAKIAPKRPASCPKISVFAANSVVKSSNNLDEIIANQMLVAKQEARARAGSENSAAPPIPERKNVPSNGQLNRSLSADNKTKPRIETRKRVAFSTFYTSSEVDTSNTLNNNITQKTPKPSVQPRNAPRRPAEPSHVSNAPKPNTSTPQHVAPVPRRPAPPRPGAMKSGSNLIEFSPDKERADTGLDNECDEIVADLDKRIAEIEADLQKYVARKEQLELQLSENSSADMGEQGENEATPDAAALQEEIDFTEANIAGLTDELNSLKESLYQFKPDRMHADLELQRKAEQQKLQIEEQRRKEEEERKHREEVIAKHKETRTRVIQEILQTEKDYLHSISLCLDVFPTADSQRPCGIDIELLFGNMDEVVALSQRLLTALEEATQGKDFDQQILGRCFVSLKADMTRVYAPYCRNHDDVITLLEKYEESSEIQEYFNKKVDIMRESCTVFDLGSVLIKPVQRILKYPLLLNELIKNTEEDHPDKAELMSAVNVMTQVAAAINEYKRRKDLVRKYKAVKEEGIGEKFSKFNVHSTKKKFARLSQKMVGPLTVDEDFNREERKYKNLESAIRLLTRDLNVYMEQVQDATYCLETVANDLYDYYDDQSQQHRIQQYCQCTNEIATKQLYKYKQQVELQVLHPLNRLLILYQAPNKVIKKRHDKLLDYDNLIGKGIGGKEVQVAKNNYEALNAQLLDELPKLYMLSMELIHECLGRLVRAQKCYYIACIEALYKLPDEFLMSLDHESMDSFNLSHQHAVEKLSQLAFIPKTFNPNIDERRVNLKERRASEYQEPEWSNSQTSAMRAQLRTNYGNDKVYIVTSEYVGKGMMDLTLSKGTLVGVIKDRDPMGNKDRFFVDNGVSKGMFPSTHLGPAPSSATSSPARPDSATKSGENLLGLDTPAKPNLAVSAFDHPTLFDAVCSPTFGQILQPQPASGQSTALIQPDNQSYSVIHPHSPINQSTDLLQPAPAANQSDSSAQDSMNQSKLSEQNSNFDDNLVESEDLSDVYIDEWYQAMYAFAARTEIEVSVEEGQMCKVIETHDLEGNNEWWLVEINGTQGYVPANYLRAL